MKKFMLSSLIFFRSRRDAKRHSRETVSAIWSHKGGKKRRFVVKFNRVESFRDIYNGEHFGILQERELFFDCRNGVHGSADRFVYRLARIYTYPDVSIRFLLYQYVWQPISVLRDWLDCPVVQSLDKSSLTLSSLDTGMRRLGAWTGVTLGPISICRGFPRGFPRPGSKIFA